MFLEILVSTTFCTNFSFYINPLIISIPLISLFFGQFLETEKYKLRYENRRSQQNEDYERVRAGFENREADLNEALKAKDSQLAVLRVRIQETDAELQGKTKSLEEIQAQNER